MKKKENIPVSVLVCLFVLIASPIWFTYFVLSDRKFRQAVVNYGLNILGFLE